MFTLLPIDATVAFAIFTLIASFVVSCFGLLRAALNAVAVTSKK